MPFPIESLFSDRVRLTPELNINGLEDVSLHHSCHDEGIIPEYLKFVSRNVSERCVRHFWLRSESHEGITVLRLIGTLQSHNHC